MPLNLSGTSVHHGAGEDGHNGGVRIEYTLLHHSVMLFDPHVQGNIVVLGESSQRVKQQNWVLENREFQISDGVFGLKFYYAQISTNVVYQLGLTRI